MRKGLGHSHHQWCEWIKEQQLGDDSVMAFCRRRGLSAHNFHYHKKRMKDRDAHTGFIEVKESRGQGVCLGFQSGSWRLEVQEGFDPELLRRVVEALG